MRDLATRSGSLMRLFIRHPNGANLLMVLMILFGVFALLRINSQFFPTVDRPTINISIAWSGASAEDVEQGILAVVEPQVRFIDDVKEIRSIAREGRASIQVEFNESADMQKAAADVEAAVQAISNLPEDSELPRISRSQFFDGVASLSISGGQSEEVLRRWAKKIRDDLIDRGIDKVNLNGLRAEEVLIEVSESDLRRFSLTIGELSGIVARATRDLPSGAIGGGVERQLRILASADDARTLRKLEIKALPGGERLLLEDVATVRTAYDEDAVIGQSRGLQAIEIDVRRAPTADTLETAAIFNAYVAELRTQLPPDIKLQIYDVSADALSDRIMLLIKNGIGGLILVVAILFIFLDFRVAFWVAAGIPVALLATIGVMLVLGQTINMMSLFALIMMLGIIVDDAIVVGEHTATRLEMGDSPEIAAENGVGMMIMPVLAAMTTTLAAFFPMVLITGVIGQIMGVLPYVAVSVLIASLIECFFILPAHLAHSMRKAGQVRPRWSYWRQIFFGLVILGTAYGATRLGAGAQDGSALAALSAFMAEKSPMLVAAIFTAFAWMTSAVFEAAILFARRKSADRAVRRAELGLAPDGPRIWFDRNFARFRDGPFTALVRLAYDWRYVTVSVAVSLMLVIGIGLMRGDRVRFVFFPSPEAEKISGYVTMQAGTPRDVVRATVGRIEERLSAIETELGKGDQLISAVYTQIGRAGRNTGDNLAQISVTLVPTEQRSVRTGDFVSAWRASVPQIAGVERFSIIEQRGGPPGRDVDVRLEGGSSAELKLAASEVADHLMLMPGVSGVTDDLPYGKPELVLTLTPRGAALGLTLDDVGRQIRNALEGAVARTLVRGDDEIELRIVRRTAPEGRSALQAMEVRTPAGNYVPLSEIVAVEERQGFSVIERVDGKTRISVTGDLDAAVNTTDGIVEDLRSSGFLEGIATKYGIETGFGGRAQEQREAFADVGLGTVLALSAIYIVIAWVFGSYTRPFAVMLIIPFGYVGAVFGHWVMGFDLTMLSLIGLLGLAGILVNDSIILVTRYADRLENGEDGRAAAIGASGDRLRAVLLTSLTTIGGLLPLLYEKSLQAQFLLPMAITFVYGLAVATLLVLFLVPALLGIGADIRAVFHAIFPPARSDAQSAQPAE